jgi:hypothetical protein
MRALDVELGCRSQLSITLSISIQCDSLQPSKTPVALSLLNLPSTGQSTDDSPSVSALSSISCCKSINRVRTCHACSNHVILKWVQVGEAKTQVWQSTMSNQASNRKRSASTAGMGPPEKESTTKKPKLDTALEATLTKLKQVLHPDNLVLEWADYDPGLFMDEMRRMGREINALNLDTVGEYITDGLDADLRMLDHQEIGLGRRVDPNSVKAEYLELAQGVHKDMIKYVARVRARLTGQS